MKHAARRLMVRFPGLQSLSVEFARSTCSCVSMTPRIAKTGNRNSLTTKKTFFFHLHNRGCNSLTWSVKKKVKTQNVSCPHHSLNGLSPKEIIVYALHTIQWKDLKITNWTLFKFEYCFYFGTKKLIVTVTQFVCMVLSGFECFLSVQKRALEVIWEFWTVRRCEFEVEWMFLCLCGLDPNRPHNPKCRRKLV